MTIYHLFLPSLSKVCYRVRLIHASGGVAVRRMADRIMKSVQDVPEEEQLGTNTAPHIIFPLLPQLLPSVKKSPEATHPHQLSVTRQLFCGVGFATPNSHRDGRSDGREDLPDGSSRPWSDGGHCRAVHQEDCCGLGPTKHPLPCMHSHPSSLNAQHLFSVVSTIHSNS